MKYFSEKLTSYIVKSGAVPEESYEIYQYGFQIGLEMLSCLLACFGIAVYLHMIPEFAVVTGIFMMLRSFVGGVHLNSFDACFICRCSFHWCDNSQCAIFLAYGNAKTTKFTFCLNFKIFKMFFIQIG